MDTSTGEIYYGNDAVKKAFDSGKIKDMDALVELPIDIAQELIGMNRQGRRAWWKQNRKKLNLPRWNERQSITPITNEDNSNPTNSDKRDEDHHREQCEGRY